MCDKYLSIKNETRLELFLTKKGTEWGWNRSPLRTQRTEWD